MVASRERMKWVLHSRMATIWWNTEQSAIVFSSLRFDCGTWNTKNSLSARTELPQLILFIHSLVARLCYLLLLLFRSRCRWRGRTDGHHEWLSSAAAQATTPENGVNLWFSPRFSRNNPKVTKSRRITSFNNGSVQLNSSFFNDDDCDPNDFKSRRYRKAFILTTVYGILQVWWSLVNSSAAWRQKTRPEIGLSVTVETMTMNGQGILLWWGWWYQTGKAMYRWNNCKCRIRWRIRKNDLIRN